MYTQYEIVPSHRSIGIRMTRAIQLPFCVNVTTRRQAKKSAIHVYPIDAPTSEDGCSSHHNNASTPPNKPRSIRLRSTAFASKKRRTESDRHAIANKIPNASASARQGIRIFSAVVPGNQICE